MTDNEFSSYVHEFHSTVFRLAYSYLKNREDAEDIAQETFLKLYCSRVEFSDAGHIKGWLIRVAVNLCKDHLRSSWFKHRTELTTDIPCNTAELYFFTITKDIRQRRYLTLYKYKTSRSSGGLVCY